jgi:hypothetical protein
MLSLRNEFRRVRLERSVAWLTALERLRKAHLDATASF